MHSILTMKRITKSTLGGFVALLLGLALLATLQAPSAHAAPAPAVTVAAVGNGLQFNASYSRAVQWEVWVSPDSISWAGAVPSFPYYNTGTGRQHTSNISRLTTFNPFVYGLKPNTTYNYIVKIWDDASLSAGYQTGSAKTLNRAINVTFTQVYVAGDGDELSAGDLTFFFNINGNWNWYKPVGPVQVASGHSVYPNQTRGYGFQPSGYYNKNTLPLAVQMQDDDCDFWDGLCSSGLGPNTYADSGSDSLMTWATARTTLDFNWVSHPWNGVSQSYSFRETGYGLDFTVYVTVQFTYTA
jgi:hypothetical protein